MTGTHNSLNRFFGTGDTRVKRTIPETKYVPPEKTGVFCPDTTTDLQSEHPRVFLSLAQGSAQCPYCSAVYTHTAHADDRSA